MKTTLLVLALLGSLAIAHGQSSAQHEPAPKLCGSTESISQNTLDLAVIVGRITSLQPQQVLTPTQSRNEATVQITQVLGRDENFPEFRNQVQPGASIHVTIDFNPELAEVAPTNGKPYIFFLHFYVVNTISWLAAVKVLPDTPNNIAATKKQIPTFPPVRANL